MVVRYAYIGCTNGQEGNMTNTHESSVAIHVESGTIYNAGDLKVVKSTWRVEQLQKGNSDESIHDIVKYENTIAEELSSLDLVRSKLNVLRNHTNNVQTDIVDPIKREIARGNTVEIESLDDLRRLFENWSYSDQLDFDPYCNEIPVGVPFSGVLPLTVRTSDPDMNADKLAELILEQLSDSIDAELIRYSDDLTSISQDSSYVDFDFDDQFDVRLDD
jgi:hypothetical protein